MKDGHLIHASGVPPITSVPITRNQGGYDSFSLWSGVLLQFLLVIWVINGCGHPLITLQHAQQTSSGKPTFPQMILDCTAQWKRHPRDEIQGKKGEEGGGAPQHMRKTQK